MSTTYCNHVYEYSNPGPCGICGYLTNDINWKEERRLHEEHKEKVGYFYNTNSWWSI
jgi:hypothetical protein